MGQGCATPEPRLQSRTAQQIGICTVFVDMFRWLRLQCAQPTAVQTPAGTLTKARTGGGTAGQGGRRPSSKVSRSLRVFDRAFGLFGLWVTQP